MLTDTSQLSNMGILKMENVSNVSINSILLTGNVYVLRMVNARMKIA